MYVVLLLRHNKNNNRYLIIWVTVPHQMFLELIFIRDLLNMSLIMQLFDNSNIEEEGRSRD